jgi:hypothetical protein
MDRPQLSPLAAGFEGLSLIVIVNFGPYWKTWTASVQGTLNDDDDDDDDNNNLILVARGSVVG